MEFVSAVGFQHFWGFTPALALTPPAPGQCHILLAGTGDIRHMVKTASETCTSETAYELHVRCMQFYLHEPKSEVLARALLLTVILTDTQLPVRDRVETFLEVYGNSMVREKTADYVSEKSSLLIDLVTGHRAPAWLQPLFDLSALKFKDKDDLCDVFMSWKASVPFDVSHLRDQRLRYYCKERYDHRANLADWDYHMRLVKVVPQVSYREYKDWRQTGVAYEFRLATYPAPNRTLASYIPGTSVLRYAENHPRLGRCARLLGRYRHESVLGLWNRGGLLRRLFGDNESDCQYD